MSRLTPEDLESMREEGLSDEVRRNFEDSKRAVAEWARRQPKSGLDDLLAWVDELRSVFGDPEVNRKPWAGDDFRL